MLAANKRKKREMNRSNLDPHFWGPSGWTFLHSVAEGYPETPDDEHKQAAIQMFTGLRKLLPCSSCCDHCCQQLEDHPVHEHVNSRDDLAKYVFDFHNRVNARLGKPQHSWDDYVSHYRSNESQCGMKATENGRGCGCGGSKNVILLIILAAVIGTLVWSALRSRK